MEQALQMRLDRAHLLMVHSELVHQVRALDLGLEYVPAASPHRPCTAPLRPESSGRDILVLNEHGKGLLEIGKLEVVDLHRIRHVGPDAIKFCRFCIGVARCQQ